MFFMAALPPAFHPGSESGPGLALSSQVPGFWKSLSLSLCLMTWAFLKSTGDLGLSDVF